jgi:hypothetical protein
VGKPAIVAVPLIIVSDFVTVNVVDGNALPGVPVELCGDGCVYVRPCPVGVFQETVNSSVLAPQNIPPFPSLIKT